jgi:nucleoside-diphosphate-sugar epimerase
MKVFVAGATGILGRGLLRRFRDRGHGVAGLARSEEGERIVRSLGGKAARRISSTRIPRAGSRCG